MSDDGDGAGTGAGADGEGDERGSGGGGDVRLLDDATADLLEWHGEVVGRHESAFEAAKALSTRLGAHYRPDEDVTAVGFWTPELLEMGVGAEDVYLEVLTPVEPVDLSGAEATATFERERVPLRRTGAYHWGVVDGMRPGTRDRLGSLYQLAYRHEGEWHAVQDPLAYSVPFGAFAPAELYDMDRLDRGRADRGYFEALGTDDERVPTTEDDGLPRIDPATSMLEIHPGTATDEGTLGGLARWYGEIGRKQRAGEALTPAERNFVGYDAIQLMPVEPITENRDAPDFWRPAAGATADASPAAGADEDDTGRADGTAAGDGTADVGAAGDGTAGDGTTGTGTAGDGDPGDDGPNVVGPADGRAAEVEVTVARPELINWGYDIVLRAFSAPNPAICGSGRPDELVDFIAACHDLPRPIRVVFDVALGHADDRGAELLPDDYFEGPGMYGKHLNYQHPTVRAILLEMQRRKMDFGADGIRVDGAQDFTYYDPEREENVHDDAFLAEMDEVVQEVAGTEYRPWMIYEDGRPWPREDWELASTYRALIEQHPHSFQWSPITFAHNTPALLTFWATKWWRVREVAEFGSHWITGVANHDTVRRGTQIDPTVEFNQSPVNPYLGETLQNTLDEAYDSPAATMLFHCFMPGVPMDFVNANMRAPWGFIRDTDATWNVKVVADESNFIDWQVRPEDYQRPEHFEHCKALGFENRDELRGFMRALSAAVEATDYDLGTMAEMLSALDPPLGSDLDAAALERFGYAWMRDVHEFATLSHWHDAQDDDRTAFDRAVREFRQDRPWLRRDVRFEGDEAYGYRHPTNGTVLYYGLRRAPDGSEELLFAANMEGVPVETSPAGLAGEMAETDVAESGWEPALVSPAVESGGTVELANGDAVVWRREP